MNNEEDFDLPPYNDESTPFSITLLPAKQTPQPSLNTVKSLQLNLDTPVPAKYTHSTKYFLFIDIAGQLSENLNDFFFSLHYINDRVIHQTISLHNYFLVLFNKCTLFNEQEDIILKNSIKDG